MKINRLVAIVVILAIALTFYALYGPRVTASVDTNLQHSCPIGSPIKVSVTNVTFKRLARVHMELEAWRDGRSKNVLSNRYFTFDRALSPFESATVCLSDKAVSIKYDPKNTDVMGQVIHGVNESISKTSGLEIAIMKLTPEYL